VVRGLCLAREESAPSTFLAATGPGEPGLFLMNRGCVTWVTEFLALMNREWQHDISAR